MPTIDDFEVPSPLMDEYQRLVAEADAELLLEFVRNHADLVKGLQIKKSSAPAIRQRMSQALSRARALSPDWLEFLAQAGLNQDVVVVLSECVLEACLPDFLALYGRDRFLAAVLADSRPGVRKLAVRQLERAAAADFPDADQAARRLRDRLETFGRHAASWLAERPAPPAGEPAPPPPGEGEVPALRARVAELEDELREVQARRKREKALQDKIDELKARAAELEAALGGERRATAAGRALAEQRSLEARQAQGALAEEKAAMDSRVREGVERELRHVLRGWLASAARAEEAARAAEAASPEQDLLARAEAALEAQARRDRAAGSRRVLRERLAALEAMLRRVREGVVDSLSPAVELERLAEELEKEAGRLRGIVGGAARPVGLFAQSLRARLAHAEGADELDRLHALLLELDDEKLLSAAQLQALYGAYHDRMAQAYDRYAPARPEGREPNDPVWGLMRKLSEGEPVLLLVDGHNVLLAVPELFSRDAAGGPPDAPARARLVALTAELLGGSARAEARVYYDGPVRQEIAHGPMVKEIYSGGGQAEHRADTVILQDLEFCRAAQRQGPWILVTDDRELRGEAKRLGALTVPVAQFAAALGRVIETGDDRKGRT